MITFSEKNCRNIKRNPTMQVKCTILAWNNKGRLAKIRHRITTIPP
jgi:hypothetical protein